MGKRKEIRGQGKRILALHAKRNLGFTQSFLRVGRGKGGRGREFLSFDWQKRETEVHRHQEKRWLHSENSKFTMRTSSVLAVAGKGMCFPEVEKKKKERNNPTNGRRKDIVRTERGSYASRRVPHPISTTKEPKEQR